MGRLWGVQLSCYMVLLLTDSQTKQQDSRIPITRPVSINHLALESII